MQDIFRDLIIQQQVKTKTKTEKVDLIKAGDFFQRLHDMGLKNRAEIHKNLMTFLCIDKNFVNNLMIKKISRTLQEFTESPYMKASGTRKRKLPIRSKVISPAQEAKPENKPVFEEESALVESNLEDSKVQEDLRQK